jgi:RimJ/RimL family protein N-acetyltransferase
LIEPVTLTGKHVTLRPLAASDAAALREIASGSRETFVWANVPQPDQVDTYVSRALESAAKKQALVFAICNAGEAVVGCTRLFDLQRWEWLPGTDPRPGQDILDACEIGYTWLAPRAQRTPINTEAKLLLLGHAFETWKCYRVTIKTDERNDRSRRAIERLGAKADGILRQAHPAVDGKPRNTAYYAVIAEEWPRVKAGLLARLA